VINRAQDGLPEPNFSDESKKLDGPGSGHETPLAAAKKDFRQLNAPRKP
jgi:hypothetical protein